MSDAVNVLKTNGLPLPGIPWAEWLEPNGQPYSEVAFSYEQGNQAVMSFQVDWGNHLSAVLFLLGNNYYSNGQINRTPPQTHPIYPWLYCTRITSVKGHKWLGKGSGSGLSTFGGSSFWQFAIITAVFTQLKYRVLSDDDLDRIYPPVNGVRQEQFRNMEFVPQIGVESLSREGGSFKWVEGPLAGQLFNSPQPMSLSKADLIFTQRKVPFFKGLLSSASNYTKASILDSFVGTINQAALLNRPAQTMRFVGYRITPEESPLGPAGMFLPAATGLPSLTASVEYNFSYFDPPPFNVQRGWNLAPIPNDPQGRWAAISTTGVATDASVFQVKDFSTFFTSPG